MYKEVHLATFNIIVSHNNGERCEIKVQAENSVEARRVCEEIKSKNKDMLERWETMNVFATKRIEDCVLCPRDWRDELLIP